MATLDTAISTTHDTIMETITVVIHDIIATTATITRVTTTTEIIMDTLMVTMVIQEVVCRCILGFKKTRLLSRNQVFYYKATF